MPKLNFSKKHHVSASCQTKPLLSLLRLASILSELFGNWEKEQLPTSALSLLCFPPIINLLLSESFYLFLYHLHHHDPTSTSIIYRSSMF